MSTRMPVSGAYGTHLAPLIQAMSKTDGDVLELGLGVFSTPYLHYQCILSDRKLVSYENDAGWAHFFIKYGYENPNHEIKVVDNYDEADIEKKWDVVLVDHSPSARRVVDIKRLANLAKYIIIHDSNDNARSRREYNYASIYPLFKYQTIWDKDNTFATVLSNLVELDDFWK